MGKKRYLAKILGLQHPHDKAVEILNNLGYKGKLLDAPAGDGQISKKLRENGFDVVGADINPQQFCADGISCCKVDLNDDLPFEDESFDFILCSNGIEHLEAPFQFVRECYRILRTEGKLLITTPNMLSLRARAANALVGFDTFKGRPQDEVRDYAGGGHNNLSTYYQLRINLHRNGFRILQATTHMFSHTAMLLFPIYPLIYITTYRSFRRERDTLQRKRNEEIIKHVMSPDLIFGKKLFLLARKDRDYLRVQS